MNSKKYITIIDKGYITFYNREKDIIDKMLSSKEKQEVEMSLDRVMDLKGNDKTYFQLYIRTLLKKNLGFDLVNMNLQNPDRIAATKSFWPPNDPNWYRMNLSASGSASGASSSGAKAGGADSKAAEAEKAPVKEVKYYYLKEICI
jgi:hypothetical protein